MPHTHTMECYLALKRGGGTDTHYSADEPWEHYPKRKKKGKIQSQSQVFIVPFI